MQPTDIFFQTSDFVFYLCLGLGLLFLFMLKKDKPKLPTPLDMKELNSSKKNYKNKQLQGPKSVEAKVIHAEFAADQMTDSQSVDDAHTPWASPTILVNGKPKDAYSILGLDSGASIQQVRTHVALLLQGKLTAAKIDIIKRAYQAIIDANTP